MVFNQMNPVHAQVQNDGKLIAIVGLVDESADPPSGFRLSLDRTFRFSVAPADSCPAHIISQIWYALQIGRVSGKADGYDWNIVENPLNWLV